MIAVKCLFQRGSPPKHWFFQWEKIFLYRQKHLFSILEWLLERSFWILMWFVDVFLGLVHFLQQFLALWPTWSCLVPEVVTFSHHGLLQNLNLSPTPFFFRNPSLRHRSDSTAATATCQSFEVRYWVSLYSVSWEGPGKLQHTPISHNPGNPLTQLWKNSLLAKV